ncbi:hypothetical protein Rsub_01873 [Raphidocelis subcapitata]|uniref:Uncharacterized protein n=1 Tax=Raphidocelis subcapitata TaxID=307507 RepID=A0A2V0NNL7_9CHLO|nr:hypothetical protein Rsub_01873 [Raphidocelis subcapitata]|eukprot:GBF89156.1 hypothetical protein Rsub_01873 [Raphidocelis subcapitata]
MSWFGGKKGPEEAQDPDSMGKGRFAAPPPCPRCELTKGQMNRTIQNYQKAYRKKVEGLKTELVSTRADNQQLRSQVRRLRRRKLVHAPSVIVGAAVGVLVADRVKELLRGLRQRLRRGGKGDGVDAAVPAGVEGEAAGAA